jgi:hypothetical protein
MEATTLELKYCERCGALGLRRPQSSATYCESCAQVLTRNVFSLHLGGRRRRSKPEAEIHRPIPALQAESSPVTQVRR